VDKFDIRPVALSERHAVADTVRAALLTGAIADDVLESYGASWDGGDFIAAWDGSRCVGNVGAFHFDTTVPGGSRLTTAGVTEVGILPTHTRRGLLTSMLTRLLDEAHSAGTVLASLRASEAPIYGRFGFGLAGDTVAAEIDTRRARPLRIDPPTGSMRILERDELLSTVPPIYALSRWRVGTVNRPDWLWPLKLKAAGKPTDNPWGKGIFIAVHSNDAGADDGYVHYEVEWDEDFADNPTGKGKIIDLWGASPEVELALWDYVLGIDLVLVWRAEPRPTDDPIRRAMYDTRAYETRQRLDEQWVRLLDVDTALSQRSYGATKRSVTLEIADPLFEENCGRWTISSAGAARSDVEPDLSIDIATISATYLGGVSWAGLKASGALPIASAQALADLDALFDVGLAPFSGTMF
jgi:predicted acetyltransferase